MHNTRLHICACILTQSALILSLSDYLIYTCTHWLTHSHLRALSETDRHTNGHIETDRDSHCRTLELSSTVGSSWMLASVSIAADLLRRLAARLTSVLRFDDHPTCPFTDSSSTEDTALTPLTPVIRKNTIHHYR